jgi:hypothetical protein
MGLSKKQLFGIVGAVAISTVITNYEALLPYRWQTFNSPEGDFSVDLPGNPTVEESQVPSAAGGTIALHEVGTRPNKSTYFSCVYLKDESFAHRSADEVLDTARDGSIKNVQGTIVAEQRTTIAGYPARDIHARARGNSLLDSRLVLVAGRLYMLMVVDTARKDRDVKNVQNFFNSFKVLR